MGETSKKSLSRRELLRLGVAGTLGFIGATVLPHEGSNPPVKDIIRASESRRDGTPVVARMELTGNDGIDPKLEDMIRNGGIGLHSLIDLPTDSVTLYAERLRLLGEPIPQEVEQAVADLVVEYSLKISNILAGK